MYLAWAFVRCRGGELAIGHHLRVHRFYARKRARRNATVAIEAVAPKLGMINDRRGHITVLDRAVLRELICKCYNMVKRESDRLLPWHVGLTNRKRIGSGMAG